MSHLRFQALSLAFLLFLSLQLNGQTGSIENGFSREKASAMWIEAGTIHTPVAIYDVRFIGSTSKLLSIDADTSARIWNSDAGSLLHRLTGFDLRYSGYAMILSASYSPDGRHVVTQHNNDTTAWLWDVTTGEHLATFSAHYMFAYGGRNIVPERFHPDSRSFLSARGWFVHEWDIASHEMLQAIGPTAFGHSTRETIFSPDGSRILTLSTDNGSSYTMVHLWETQTGKKLFEKALGTYAIDAVFSPDNTSLLITMYQGKTLVIDWKQGRLVRTITTHDGYNISSIVASPDGARLFPLKYNTGSGVRSAFTGQVLYYPKYSGLGPRSATFSPDGKHLIIGFMDGMIRIYNAETGVQFDSLVGHTDAVRSIAFNSEASRIVTAGEDSTIRIWGKPSAGVESEPVTEAMLLDVQTPLSGRDITIRYGITRAGHVELVLYDALGNEVERLMDEVMEPDTYIITFNSDAIPTGSYFISLEGRDGERITRMLTIQ
jgi:WD40 repeat protein